MTAYQTYPIAMELFMDYQRRRPVNKMWQLPKPQFQAWLKWRTGWYIACLEHAPAWGVARETMIKVLDDVAQATSSMF